MIITRFLSGMIFLLTLSGCSYDVAVNTSPAYNVYSSYGEPISGHWALYVDSRNFGARVVHPNSWACSAHDFPIDIAAPFRNSVVETFDGLFETIDLVDAPFSENTFPKDKYMGQIAIHGESFDSQIWFGFHVDAEVKLEVSAVVDGPEDRLLETTVSSRRDSQGSVRFACKGGAGVLGNASEKAIEEVLDRLGERITNSHKIRQYMDRIRQFVQIRPPLDQIRF